MRTSNWILTGFAAAVLAAPAASPAALAAVAHQGKPDWKEQKKEQKAEAKDQRKAEKRSRLDDEWDRRFAGLDSNNDGRITRDEWRGNYQAFSNQDWNGDGVLSGDEVRVGARGSSGGWERRFGDLDANGDGRLSSKEWQGEQAYFARLDENRNGWLSRDEFSAREQGRPLGHFDELDKNNDETISEPEWWPADPRAFTLLDDNRDRLLTRQELSDPETPAGTGGGWSPRFDDVDANRDGRVSRDEWQSEPWLFTRLDDNRDGWLGRSEFLDRDQAGSSVNSDVRFDRLDRNNDGRITEEEWPDDFRAFSNLDANHDRRLTRDEFASQADLQTPESRFQRMDGDNDGRLSREEFDGGIDAFTRLDLNRDGALSPVEFFNGRGTESAAERAHRAGFERGRLEGVTAGREDKTRRQGFDLEGQQELGTARSGYEDRFGPLESYQAGYRAGFRAGYVEGYGPRH